MDYDERSIANNSQGVWPAKFYEQQANNPKGK